MGKPQKKGKPQKRPLELVRVTGDPKETGNKENLEVNTIRTQDEHGEKTVGAVRPRDSWETPGIIDLGNFTFSVKSGDNVTLHDVNTLSKLFPEFAAAATKFARELEMEAEGFITAAVHSLVWPIPKEKRHHVYTQISGQAGYVERTKYPRYLRDAVRSTWHYPGERFSDPDEDTEIIYQSSDSSPDYDPE